VNHKPCCRRETARCYSKFRPIWSVQAVVFFWY